MPFIDVTDIILDPMIAGEVFTVIRSVETVNNYGESVVTYQTLSGAGSVTPTGANSLVREEAYQTQAKTIRVVTTFALRGASKDENGVSYQPDIVVWRGNHFIVKSMDDFSQYGSGFVDVECASINQTELTPMTFSSQADLSAYRSAIGALIFDNLGSSLVFGG